MYACVKINIHVAVVKTGLPGDQTLLTEEASMKSSAAHQLQHRREDGRVSGETIRELHSRYRVNIWKCFFINH